MESHTFQLQTERLGPLPLINHFLDRLGLFPVLDRFVPTTDWSCRIAYARGLGVLLRSILTEREPIYSRKVLVRVVVYWSCLCVPRKLRASLCRFTAIGREKSVSNNVATSVR